jgi:O-antigen ligase
VLPLREGEVRRPTIWAGTVDLALEQPLVGVGLDAFRYAYPGGGREDFGRWVTIAENDVLQWAAEGGVALLALGAFGSFVAARSLRRRFHGADRLSRAAARLTLCGGLGLLLPCSITGVPLHVPAVMAAAVLVWAGAWACLSPRAAGPAEAEGLLFPPR